MQGRVASQAQGWQKAIVRVWRHPANRGRRGRRVLRFSAVRLFGRVTGRAVAVHFGDRSRIQIDPRDTSAPVVLRAPVPDWAEMQVWKTVLGPGDLFVDVGAHLGVYSIWAAEQGASVISIEANPVMAERVASNMALNGYPVDVRAVAVSNQPGTVRISGPDDARQALDLAGDHGTLVPAETLDQLVGDRRAAGLKIDVEGAERLVLEGAQALLADQRLGLIQLEWNGESEAMLGEDRSPVARILVEAGYELLRPDGSGQLVPTDAEGFGSDVFARPRTGPS